MANTPRYSLLVLLLSACGEIVPIPLDAAAPDAAPAPLDSAPLDGSSDARLAPDADVSDPCEGPPVDAAGVCEAHDLTGLLGSPGEVLTLGEAVVSAPGGSLAFAAAGLGVAGGALLAVEPGESLLLTFPSAFSAHLILDFDGAFWIRAGTEAPVLHDGYPSVYLPAGTGSVELLPAHGSLALVRVLLNCGLC